MKKKASRIDYSKSMLPRSRREQFLDCFKMNYLTLLKCGLMLLLFFAPLLAFSVFMDFYYVSLMSHAAEEVKQTEMIFLLIYSGGLIVLSILAIVGLSGIIRVLRNLIWGEGIFFKDDFVDGIKENAPKNIVFYLIFGVFFELAFFVFCIFRENIIALFGIILFALVFLPIYFWIMLLNNTYNSKWGGLLRNGLFFFVKSIGWSMLGILVFLLPSALELLLFASFGFVWLKYVILVLIIVFVYPIIVLITILYSTAKFDEYINKDYYPDYFLRGLNNQ